MLAPMAKEEKCISFLWMIVVPLFLVIMMKYLHLGYWPGFLVFSFVPLLCRLFPIILKYSTSTFIRCSNKYFIFLVKYLWNLICLMESWVLGLLYTYLGFMNRQ